MSVAEDRREFLKQTGMAAAMSAGLALAEGSARAGSPAERVRVGLIGCGGRGSGLAREFASDPGCEITHVCDVDSARAGKLADALQSVGVKRRPQVAGDLRTVLDDGSVDAVVVATPDHWHAPAGVLACDAGKHVYVEKPCSHNVREGRLLVEAARRNKRVVQHGTQSRSNQFIADAVQMLREGIIGDVLVAKAWNVQRRQNIGHGKPSDPPPGVDYETWIGPAPMVPFQSNRFHYHWHWWYDFGTGDMGNDGVHELDYARWGLGVETHPTRIAGAGTKLFFDDDQQFPDTQQIAFEYPGDGKVGSRRMLLWEMRIWSQNYPYNIDNGVEFFGTEGHMVLTKRGRVEIFAPRHQRIEPKWNGPRRTLLSHHADFLEAIRMERAPNAEIELGHLSTSLCHLGNIATRLNRALHFDPQHERVLGDDIADGLLGRMYRENHWAVPKDVRPI